MQKKIWIFALMVGCITQSFGIVDISKPYGYELTDDEERLRHQWRHETDDQDKVISERKWQLLFKSSDFRKEIEAEQGFLLEKGHLLEQKKITCGKLETEIEKLKKEIQQTSQIFST